MISSFFQRIRRLLWLLPAFLLWASFPPMGEKTDILFALAPLMWLSRQGGVRCSVRRWYLNGFVFYLLTLKWMIAIVANGGPWPLVALGWIALSGYSALYFGLYGYLSAKVWAWVRSCSCHAYLWRLAAILIVEPILWCGLELVRSRFLGGFAWNQLGVTAAVAGFGAPAALGGVYLLSAVIVLINGTFAGVAERIIHRLRFGSLENLLALALVAGIYWAAPQPAVDEAAATLKVGLVQRNLPCVFQGLAVEDTQTVYSQLLTGITALQPDLVVLAESALVEFGAADRPAAARFADWLLGETGAKRLLAGGNRREAGKAYNSAALFTAGGGVEFYDKVHLVPFGEFIPLDKTFPALQRFAPVGTCHSGSRRLLDELGVAICFEDTDAAHVRMLAKMGAKALVFITNDSWFAHSVEAEQHAWQAVARAVETGLAVARVGNSGVTGIIGLDGRADWLIDDRGRPLIDQPGAMLARLPLAGEGTAKTPYVRLGDWPLALGFAFLLAVSGVLIRRD